MMKVQVICQGKLKERFYTDACAEYSKRLSAFCNLGITELSEGQDVRPAIPAGAYVVAMAVEGDKLSSEGLAKLLRDCALQGKSRLCFLIGGSDGLDETVKREADYRLSMSDMTFPHHLARVMVLEQIYRAFSINAGTKYHK